MRRRAVALIAMFIFIVGAGSCRRPPERLPPPAAGAGIAEQGRVIADRAGCGACHVIPGIRGAGGRVGPTLERMGERSYVAGLLPTNVENLARFIYNPQEVKPGSAMPRVGLTWEEAVDVAAYLISLR